MAETKIKPGTALLAITAIVGGAGLILWQAKKAKAGELPPPDDPIGGSAITANAEPAGSGKVIAHGSVFPQIGDTVKIEAIPNAGWFFSYWQWDTGAIFYQNPFTVVVTREAWLIANFIPTVMV